MSSPPTAGLAVSADGRLTTAEATLGGDERAVVVTEVATGRERCRVPFNVVKGYRSPVWFTPDSGSLVTVGPYEVAVWDAATGQGERTLVEAAPVRGMLHPFLRVAASPGGRYLAVFADAEPRPSSFCGRYNAFAPDDRPKFVTIWDVAA